MTVAQALQADSIRALPPESRASGALRRFTALVVLIAVVFMTTLIFLLDYGSSKFVLFLFD